MDGERERKEARPVSRGFLEREGRKMKMTGEEIGGSLEAERDGARFLAGMKYDERVAPVRDLC